MLATPIEPRRGSEDDSDSKNKNKENTRQQQKQKNQPRIRSRMSAPGFTQDDLSSVCERRLAEGASTEGRG